MSDAQMNPKYHMEKGESKGMVVLPTEVVAALGSLPQTERDIVTKFLYKIVKESRIDELTGLPNRRALTHYVEKRTSEKKSVLAIDVNRFKEINDRLGHPTGDYALRVLGRIFENTARRGNDTYFRTGGDEFIGVLEDTDDKGALLVANRIRKKVSRRLERYRAFCESKLGNGNDEFWRKALKVLGVTGVSIGIATSLNGESIKELQRYADSALYEAKNNGGIAVYRYDGIQNAH